MSSNPTQLGGAIDADAADKAERFMQLPEGPQRDALYRRHVDEHYAKGKAINMAATSEIDAVIDPAETRHWLSRGLASARVPAPAGQGVDPW